MTSWDDTFIDMVHICSDRSKDTHTKVGAVIKGEGKEIISMGYNGMPRGVDDNVPARYERPEKYKYFAHAEANAIFNLALRQLKGSSIYVQWCPCCDCAKAIIQVGIKEVVLESTDIQSSNNGKWLESCIATLIMFKETGVKVRLANKDGDITDQLLTDYRYKLESSV